MTLLDIIKQQKTEARRFIAKAELMLKNLNTSDREIILKVIAVERAFINANVSSIKDIMITRHSAIINILNKTDNIIKFAEMMPSVPGAPEEYVRPNSVPTFSKLVDTLEHSLKQEEDSIVGDPRPSPNDIKRWALKSAVLDYYNSLSIDPMMKVTHGVGELVTVDALAPNKRSIYNIWLQKLEAQHRAEDKYKLSVDEYNEAIERGIPQGGAFEKLLDRYREEFMSELWKQHYEEVGYGSNQDRRVE